MRQRERVLSRGFANRPENSDYKAPNVVADAADVRRGRIFQESLAVEACCCDSCCRRKFDATTEGKTQYEREYASRRLSRDFNWRG